jgi:outer membrane protein assembly factor BamC
MTVHMTVHKLLAPLSLIFTVSACSWIPDVPVPGINRLTGEDGMFRDRKGDYLEAETIPRTEVPAGMDSFIIDDLLVIPELPSETEQTAFLEPPRPRPIEGRSDREVVIQRMENRSWVVVDVSPSQVWPRIRDYWRQNQIEIVFENPTAGIMETGWFVLEGNALTQEKFRVMVDTGFQDNSAEIRLLQMSAPQSTPIIGQLPFPATSMEPETEYAVLSTLSSYLADVADLYQASSVSFLAGNIDSSGKATLTTTQGGNKLLQLSADYDRCWAAIGRALQRGGAEVLSQDVAQGIYDVAYMPGYDPEAAEEEEPGFFKKVFTLNGLFSGDDDLQTFNLRVQLLRTGETVEVLATPATGGEDEEGKEAGNNLLEMLRNTVA